MWKVLRVSFLFVVAAYGVSGCKSVNPYTEQVIADFDRNIEDVNVLIGSLQADVAKVTANYNDMVTKYNMMVDELIGVSNSLTTINRSLSDPYANILRKDELEKIKTLNSQLERSLNLIPAVAVIGPSYTSQQISYNNNLLQIKNDSRGILRNIEGAVSTLSRALDTTISDSYLLVGRLPDLQNQVTDAITKLPKFPLMPVPQTDSGGADMQGGVINDSLSQLSSIFYSLHANIKEAEGASLRKRDRLKTVLLAVLGSLSGAYIALRTMQEFIDDWEWLQVIP